MGKHACWTPSFQFLAKSLIVGELLVLQSPGAKVQPYGENFKRTPFPISHLSQYQKLLGVLSRFTRG